MIPTHTEMQILMMMGVIYSSGRVTHIDLTFAEQITSNLRTDLRAFKLWVGNFPPLTYAIARPPNRLDPAWDSCLKTTIATSCVSGFPYHPAREETDPASRP